MANLEKMASGNENPYHSPITPEFSGSKEPAGNNGLVSESQTEISRHEAAPIDIDGENVFPEDETIQEGIHSDDADEREMAKTLATRFHKNKTSRLDLDVEQLFILSEAGLIDITPQKMTDLLTKLKHQEEDLLN
ncbi:MAG: hypothetical protein WC805_00810 [Patescibacteria group bacterium]